MMHNITCNNEKVKHTFLTFLKFDKSLRNGTKHRKIKKSHI